MFEVGLVRPGAARADFGAGGLVHGPVSVVQARILQFLYEARAAGGATLRLTELAAAVHLTKSTVHYHVSELQRKGYVVRRSGTTGIELSPIMWSPCQDVAPD